HRPHRRASSIDGWLGLERHRHRVVRRGRRRSLVGDLDLGSRRDRICRRLHAGPESSRRQASRWRLVSQHHPLYPQLLDRRRSLVSRVTTRCGRCRLARGVLCHERWSVYHGWRVPLARAMQTGACTRTPPRFPAGSAQSRCARLHPRLRRALLRALRHAHLDRRWTFVVAQSGDSAFVGPITVSVIVTLLSLPASVLGNEAALRFGRHRAITAVMIASAAVALAIGLNVGSSPLLLLALVLIYGFIIPADSGALTSGTTASATPAYRGATLALHSTVGFGLSALGGWAAGVALDAAGGPRQPAGWSALFALLAAGVLFGPIALRWSRQGRVIAS